MEIQFAVMGSTKVFHKSEHLQKDFASDSVWDGKKKSPQTISSQADPHTKELSAISVDLTAQV